MLFYFGFLFPWFLAAIKNDDFRSAYSPDLIRQESGLFLKMYV